MTIKEGDNYIPQGSDATHAFDVVNQRHFRIGTTENEISNADYDKLADAASDYFTAGVAFLANRGYDEFLQDVGTTTWKMVNQRRVVAAFTKDIPGALIQLGVPVESVLSNTRQTTEPYVLFMNLSEGKQIVESAFTLLPPYFVYRAKSRPVETLATMTWIGSQIRDLANGRLMVDQPHMTARAEASEAHFLHEVMKRHPETDLDVVYHRIMEKYPDGLNSLPAKLWYRGSYGGDEYLNAAFN